MSYDRNNKRFTFLQSLNVARKFYNTYQLLYGFVEIKKYPWGSKYIIYKYGVSHKRMVLFTRHHWWRGNQHGSQMGI